MAKSRAAILGIALLAAAMAACGDQSRAVAPQSRTPARTMSDSGHGHVSMSYSSGYIFASGKTSTDSP